MAEQRELSSQEIRDRLFLYNVTGSYAYLSDVPSVQAVSIMYPSASLPFKLDKDNKFIPMTEDEKFAQFKSDFKPSEEAIAKAQEHIRIKQSNSA